MNDHAKVRFRETNCSGGRDDDMICWQLTGKKLVFFFIAFYLGSMRISLHNIKAKKRFL